jgi:hypothetical protein
LLLGANLWYGFYGDVLAQPELYTRKMTEVIDAVGRKAR